MNKELMMEEVILPMNALGGSYDISIELDDIEVSDTVTVVWELE